MNKSDSDKIIARLNTSSNIERTDNPENADFIIINTCSVRKSAEERVLNRLEFFKYLKKRRKNAIILCGCMAQRIGEIPDENLNFIDYIIGTYHIGKIEDIIKNQIQTDRYTMKKGYTFSDSVPETNFPFKAYINITHGCSNFCTYCVVPYLRGPVISNISKNVVDQAKKLTEQGITSIELLGQNVNYFGKDNNDISFSELLAELNSIKGIKRISFTTSHPKDFSDDIIKAVFELDKVCNHIHLPVQSGSNPILEKMHRCYSIQDYLRIIEKIRSYKKEIAITTDLIVGFPGESENNYKNTLDIVKQIEFDDAFMYKYSGRPFVKAENMDNKVPEEIKSTRLKELIDIQLEISKNRIKRFIGKDLEIIIEMSGKSENEYLGRTTYNNMVLVKDGNLKPGMYINVNIISASGKTLIGKKISREEKNAA